MHKSVFFQEELFICIHCVSPDQFVFKVEVVEGYFLVDKIGIQQTIRLNKNVLSQIIIIQTHSFFFACPFVLKWQSNFFPFNLKKKKNFCQPTSNLVRQLCLGLHLQRGKINKEKQTYYTLRSSLLQMSYGLFHKKWRYFTQNIFKKMRGGTHSVPFLKNWRALRQNIFSFSLRNICIQNCKISGFLKFFFYFGCLERFWR